MTQDVIWFQDKEFSFKLIEQAVAKSSDSYIEPGKQIHPDSFLRTAVPAEWSTKYKKPIMTLHEGMYVVIHMPQEYMEKLEPNNGKILIKEGFKAKFISKYNFNQSKKENDVPVVISKPVPPKPIPTFTEKKTYPARNNGFSKPQHSGLNRSYRTKP